MDIEKIKETYSEEQVKDILDQLESLKLQHEKLDPNNNCSNCGYNIENMGVVLLKYGVSVIQYGNFRYVNGKQKCNECREYC